MGGCGSVRDDLKTGYGVPPPLIPCFKQPVGGDTSLPPTSSPAHPPMHPPSPHEVSRTSPLEHKLGELNMNLYY